MKDLLLSYMQQLGLKSASAAERCNIMLFDLEVILQGGMKSWASSGLLVKESTEYDASSFDGINDTVQGRILPALRCAH